MGIGDWLRRRTQSGGDAAPRERQSHQDIIDHMARMYGPVQADALREIIPASGVTIHAIPARPGQNPLVLFTTGMSDRPQTVPAGQDAFRYTEIMVELPADWPLGGDNWRKPENFWPVKWLKHIAYYPHENDTWLGGPFTIVSPDEPPRPLAPNTRLSCLMLLKKLGDDGVVRCRDGRLVTLYGMTPLYTEERDLEIAQGIGALLKLLHERGVSFAVDPKRVNVVTGR